MKNFFLNILWSIFLVVFSSTSHAALKEQESWMGVYFNDKKIGFSYLKVKINERKIVVNTEVNFRIKSEGVKQPTSFTQETHLTQDLKLINFFLVQELMGRRQKINASIEKNRLFFSIASPNFNKKGSILLPSLVATSSSYLFNIIRSGLTVGKEGKISVLIEPLQTIKDIKYKIIRKVRSDLEGKQVDVYMVKRTISGMVSTSWITDSGVVLREDSPQGFRFIREPQAFATNLNDDLLSVSRLIKLSLIRPQYPIEKPRDLRKIKLKMSGMYVSDLIPGDHRQKVLTTQKLSDDRFSSTIMVESEPPILEKDAAFSVPIKSFEYAQFLEASPEVEVSHPQIRSLSKLLTQGETDSWRIAKIINHWVYTNIDKAISVNLTAVDTLQKLRGECQSHTYLFAALARSAGIPTKIVNGLVYSDDYGGFLYHAWPEVFVGKWRALDPTLGLSIVDATHIKLTEGQREDPFKLIKYIGQIRIEIIK